MDRQLKSLIVWVAGAVSALYLLNLGFGIVELIPDNLPFFGNIDEFAASIFTLALLDKLGIDFERYLR